MKMILAKQAVGKLEQVERGAQSGLLCSFVSMTCVANTMLEFLPDNGGPGQRQTA